MIIIAFGFGVGITALIQRSNPIEGVCFFALCNIHTHTDTYTPSALIELVYCSKENSFNSTTDIPILNTTNPALGIAKTDKNIYGAATESTLKHANFLVLRTLGLTGPPGGASLSFRQPCVYWFGEDYPTDDLYQKVPEAKSKPSLRDSSFMAQPKLGWFGSIPIAEPLPVQFFTVKQLRLAYLYGQDASVADSILGKRNSTDLIGLTDFGIQSATNPNSSAFISPQSDPSIGLLGTIPTRYWFNFTFNSSRAVVANGFQPVPLYSPGGNSADAMDDAIAAQLKIVANDIALVDKSILTRGNADPLDVARFLSSLDTYLQKLSYGGVFFNKVDHPGKAYEWTFNIGFDKRFTASTSFPPMGLRQLHQQTALSNSVLRNGNVTALGNAQITQGFRAMPQVSSTKLELPFDGLIGGILYPQGISFLLPIFVVTLVREKEERILIMMKLNGLAPWAYYATHFGNCFTCVLIEIV